MTATRFQPCADINNDVKENLIPGNRCFFSTRRPRDRIDRGGSITRVFFRVSGFADATNLVLFRFGAFFYLVFFSSGVTENNFSRVNREYYVIAGVMNMHRRWARK